MQLAFARNKPRIEMEKRAIMPGLGDLGFRCGRCAGVHFRAHVRPTQTNQARIRELVCHQCNTVYGFDDIGRLERGGKINGCHD